MKPTLAIMSSEEDYAMRFMEMAQKQAVFSIRAYNDEAVLEKAMQERAADILLIAAEDATEKMSQWGIRHIIFLLNHPSEKAEDGIYRYRSVSEIMREVAERCADLPRLQEEGALRDGDACLVGIFSPAGRAGCTTLALTLALLLSSKRSVLYLNLEYCSGLEHILHTKFTAGMADAVYYLRRHAPNYGIHLLSLVQKAGELQFIPPFSSLEELLDVKEEEWMQIFGELVKGGGYDVLIVDFGAVIYRCPELLQLCKVILEPVRSDFIARAKVDEFAEFLQKRELGEISEKIKQVEVPLADAPDPMEQYPDMLPFGAVGSMAKEVIEDCEL